MHLIIITLLCRVAAGIHPKATDDSSVAVGKYGSLVLIEEKGCANDLSEELEFQISDFPRLLCQHVIGIVKDMFCF